MMVPFNTNLMKLEFVAAPLMGRLVQLLFPVTITRCPTKMRCRNVPMTTEGFVQKLRCSVVNVAALVEIVTVTKFGHQHPIQVHRKSRKLGDVGCLRYGIDRSSQSQFHYIVFY